VVQLRSPLKCLAVFPAKKNEFVLFNRPFWWILADSVLVPVPVGASAESGFRRPRAIKG
jgi:hypothetical protein